MQTMMLKVWAKRLTLISEEDQRIANEDEEEHKLAQDMANIEQLEAEFQRLRPTRASPRTAMSNSDA